MDTDQAQIFLKALPENIKAFVLSQDWRNKALEIYKKYNLDPEQQEAIELEIFMSIIGMEDPTDLRENINKQASVKDPVAEKIASDIYEIIPEEIFDYSSGVVEMVDEYDPNNEQKRVGSQKSGSEDSETRQAMLNEIEHPHDSQMKTEVTEVPTQFPGIGNIPVPKKPGSMPVANNNVVGNIPIPPTPRTLTTPANLPTMQDNHALMKYYPNTEPIEAGIVDSQPVPLKPKPPRPPQPKLSDTPHYTPPQSYGQNDPYRESPQ